MSEPTEPDPRRLRADAVGLPLAVEARRNRFVLAGAGILGLLTALVCAGVVIWLPISVALGLTVITAGVGATIAMFVVLPLCAAAGVWLFVNLTVRNLRDQQATDEAIGRDGAMPPLRPAKDRSGVVGIVVLVVVLVLAFGVPALALLDR